jgi:hypothetical protein
MRAASFGRLDSVFADRLAWLEAAASSGHAPEKVPLFTARMSRRSSLRMS